MSAINKRIQFMRPRRNGRMPANYPIEGCGTPMRITRMFPMKLKDVSLEKLNKLQEESDVCCIQEMMTLFDCFERNDFSTSACQAQAQVLEKCYATHMANKFKLRDEKQMRAKKEK